MQEEQQRTATAPLEDVDAAPAEFLVPPRSRHAATRAGRSIPTASSSHGRHPGRALPIMRRPPDRRAKIPSQATSFVEVVALLERSRRFLVRTEPLQVPGVELAQVAGGPLRPEVLLGPVDHPEQLGDHLLALGVGAPAAGELLEDPRVAERPAGDHHRVGARRLVGVHSGFRRIEAARDDHRDLEPLGQLAGQGVIGPALVLRGGRSGMEADRGDARVLGEPQGEVESLAASGAESRAKLDGDRNPAALAGRRRDPDGEVLVREQRGSRAGLADLPHRAAHVDVDQVSARLGDHRRGRSHHLRVLPEELHRDGVLVRMEPKQLLQGALVAVVEPEARDHLRDGQARSVAARLEAHEPVPDPRQGSEQHAVGDLDVADAEGGCERRLHASKVRSRRCGRRSAAGRAG